MTEKIIKREDGSRIKIIVESFKTYNRNVTYRIRVLSCRKNKRTWIDIDRDNYTYRGMDMDARLIEAMRQYKEIATEKEIMQVIEIEYDLFKPNFKTNIFATNY